MAFTYVTVTHSYSEPDEDPAVGTVEFTPVTPMRNEVTVVSSPVRTTLTVGGALSQRLAANTDPETTPTGTTYRVVEKLVGQPDLTYYIQIPHDQGGTLDLRTLGGWVGGVGGGGSGTVSSINGEDPDGSGNIVLSAADVGAQPADGDLTGLAGLGDGVPVRASGTWSVASGTPDGTKFLRDDGSWQPASSGGVSSVNAQTGAVVLDADDLADGSAKVQMTTGERTKLAGVATGATANSTDAQLRDRAAHTGTQPASTITGLAAIATSGSASDLTAGTTPTARLGSGTANTTTFLRGDSTWATISGSASDTEIVPSFTLNSSAAAAANTTALTSAISTAASTGKAVRIIGAGTVWLNEFTVSANVRLIIDLGVTIKNNNPSGVTGFITGNANSVIEGYGMIDGNRAGDLLNNDSRGIFLNDPGATVKNVTIKQTAGAGVWIQPHADNCSILNTTILDTATEGIVVLVDGTTEATDYALIEGNRIERPGRLVAEGNGDEGAGIKAYGDQATDVMGPEGLRIIGNHVIDPAGDEICIEIWGFGRNTIIANNHTRGGGWGISVDGNDYCTVTGNTCVGHGSLGIEWAQARFGSCVGNTIDGRGVTDVGISITQPEDSGNQYITCVGNVVSNLNTTSGNSCINIQDGSRVLVGQNILVGPSSGIGVRIQRLLESTGINMTLLKVASNIINAGTGVQVYNDAGSGNQSAVARLVVVDNTFENCTTGVAVGGTAGGIASRYASGNKFLGVTTVKSGTITGDDDWQANFPRTANN